MSKNYISFFFLRCRRLHKTPKKEKNKKNNNKIQKNINSYPQHGTQM